MILAIRPEPGLAATIAAGRAVGLEIEGAALSEVAPIDWQVPDPAEFDVLLAGSANLFRHGGAALTALRGLPVHAVGAATAEAARAAGFTVAATGSGGLQGVLAALPPATRALRLGGTERVALTVPTGITLTERAVYTLSERPLPQAIAARLGSGAVVLLHSASSAAHFAAECERLGLARAGIALAALGPRIAAAAGTGWRAVASADRPDEAALLAVARNLCHTARRN